jgi:hypothetical protein
VNEGRWGIGLRRGLLQRRGRDRHGPAGLAMTAMGVSALRTIRTTRANRDGGRCWGGAALSRFAGEARRNALLRFAGALPPLCLHQPRATAGGRPYDRGGFLRSGRSLTGRRGMAITTVAAITIKSLICNLREMQLRPYMNAGQISLLPFAPVDCTGSQLTAGEASPCLLTTSLSTKTN